MAAPYTMGDATFFAFQKREGGPVLAGAATVYLVAMALLYAGWIALNLGGVKAYVDLVRSAAGGVSLIRRRSCP